MSSWRERHNERLARERRASFEPKTQRDMAIENLERKLRLPVSAHHVHHPITQLPNVLIEQAIEAPLVTETSTEPAAPAIFERPRRRPSRRLAFVAVVGLALTGTLIFIAGLINSPSDGIVKTYAQAEAGASPSTTPLPDNTLKGTYIRFAYPAQFSQIVTSIDDPAHWIETYVIRRPVSLQNGPSMTLAVEVAKLPVGGLGEDSSYRMRQLKNTVYTASQTTVNGEAATMMTKADGSEKTLFWPHGTLELTVAMSTQQGGALKDITGVMDVVLKNLRWNQ